MIMLLVLPMNDLSPDVVGVQDLGIVQGIVLFCLDFSIVQCGFPGQDVGPDPVPIHNGPRASEHDMSHSPDDISPLVQNQGIGTKGPGRPGKKGMAFRMNQIGFLVETYPVGHHHNLIGGIRRCRIGGFKKNLLAAQGQDCPDSQEK